jgi:SagB-type dehydrogenase family enzyme
MIIPEHISGSNITYAYHPTENTMPKSNRQFLKGYEWSRFEGIQSDQQKGLPRPAVQKPAPPDAQLIDLMRPDAFTIGSAFTIDVIRDRVSHRRFTTAPLTIGELSFLLWATQGVRGKVVADGITYIMRNVPSGGNRHPIETYLSIHRVEGIEPGLYRYLPVDHQLVLEKIDTDLPEQLNRASLRQNSASAVRPYYFIKEAAAVFIWAAVPYRSEWRYHTAAAKLVALDAGHICQNLYTAAGAIGAGTCAIGAYDQVKMDRLLELDGEDEFVIYMAPVGKIPT